MATPKTALNSIGPNVVKYRQAQGLTQEDLVIDLQFEGCWITRETLANIETQRVRVNELVVLALAKVFRIRTEELFPEQLRDGKKMKRLDEQFALRQLRCDQE